MTTRIRLLILLLCSLPIGMTVCPTASADTYYVSPTGDNSNPGNSKDLPFQTVQHAVDAMKSGDTLAVMDGCYTGTLKLKSGISIRAINPRKVIFSGAEPLAGKFEQQQGSIYKIKLETNPKQLFFRNKPMTWARWPNMKWSENWNRGKKWVGGKAGFGTLTHESLSELAGSDLAGGHCFLRFAKGNSCYSRAIKGFDGTTLQWDDENFYNRVFTGEDGKRGRMALAGGAKTTRGAFFLVGALDLLDSEGEWFASDGTLYFHAPGGGSPAVNDLLCKINDYSIYNDDVVSNVTIEGIDFFATSVKLGNPDNQKILFRDVHFSYIGSEPLFNDNLKGNREAKPIQIRGSHIGFDKCLFAGAQNTGLDLNGSLLDVRNSVFTENNRHGNFQSVPLRIHAKGTFRVTRNTFFNNCSDAIRVTFDEQYTKGKNPDVSFNHICNAGTYNTDVSGAYFPNLTQHYTEFHHNWVHNVKGNGVRLDQAGEEFTVHHNVFWSSKRGMNIEGYGKFNIYNNTSYHNKESCKLVRNVVAKKKGSNPEMVSNDTSFPPIDDWNVLNNLVHKFTDDVGPSESHPFAESKKQGELHPERAKNSSLPVLDRGSIQGNATGFKGKIFVSGNLKNLDLTPAKKVKNPGVAPNDELVKQGVTGLKTYRGAYDHNDEGWSTGSNWLPYQIKVPVTMAQAQQFAIQWRSVSIVPEVETTGLTRGRLSPNSYQPVTDEEPATPKRKRRRKKQSNK